MYAGHVVCVEPTCRAGPHGSQNTYGRSLGTFPGHKWLSAPWFPPALMVAGPVVPTCTYGTATMQMVTGLTVLTYAFGLACVFVGVVELIFGFK